MKGYRYKHYKKGILSHKNKGISRTFSGIKKEYYNSSEELSKLLRSETPYENGKKHGTKKNYSLCGTLLGETNYKNGKLDGVCRLYDSEIGDTYISYKNGKMNGPKKIFFRGIATSISNFVKGRIHGLRTQYYESGIIRLKDYLVKGKREGLLTVYDEEGRIWIVCFYKNGKECKTEIKYSKNNILSEESPYYDDSKNGIKKEYYSSGLVCCVNNCKDDYERETERFKADGRRLSYI
jgi:antitoxin component YwqK of YwqJK toxin-antitoxin module